MTTEESQPKRSGYGWIPKLSLLAVIVAFGYLYLSTRDRDATTDTVQAAAALQETMAPAETGGLSNEVMGKLSELSTSAGALVSDATEAGSELVKGVIDKVKALKGSDAETAEPAVVTTETAAPSVAEAPASAEVVVAEAQVTSPMPAAAPGVARPAPSGFASHSAPLPAAPQGRVTGETSAVAEPTAAQAPPVEEAEVSAFAESVMQGSTVATPAPSAPAATASMGAPLPAPSADAGAPVQGSVSVDPPAVTAVAPTIAPAVPGEDASAFAQPRDAMAQRAAEYRARMLAEHQKMRQMADENARAYWESMQQSMPPAVTGPMGYPGYGPAYGPAYGPPMVPGYGPAYGGVPVYPR
jgi:hypothetical protein